MRILYFLFFILILNVSNSYASWLDFSGCLVNEVVIGHNEKNGHAALNCNINNLPTCAASNYIAFDLSTMKGKQIHMTLLMALAKDLKVSGHVHQHECAPWQTNVAEVSHLRLSR